MKCKAKTLKDERCKKDAVKEGYCMQHWGMYGKKKSRSKSKSKTTKKSRSKSQGKKKGNIKKMTAAEKEIRKYSKILEKHAENDDYFISRDEVANHHFFPQGEYVFGDIAMLSGNQFESFEENIVEDERKKFDVGLPDVYYYSFVEGQLVVAFEFHSNGPDFYTSDNKPDGAADIDSGEFIMAPASIIGRLRYPDSVKRIIFSSPFTIVLKTYFIPEIFHEIRRYYFVNKQGDIQEFLDV